MKILIVDDSALVRSILKHVLGTQKDLIVVGEASNGMKAIDLNQKLEPDFIIMDINMPVMDGLEATRRIMQDKPVPVLIFSSESETDIAYKTIDIGAVDVMRKPDIDQLNEPVFYQSFLQKIRVLAEKRVLSKQSRVDSKNKPGNIIHTSRIKTSSKKISFSNPGEAGLKRNPLDKKRYKFLVIGASTGGPSAVKEVLKNLPAGFPVGIALVQHIEKGFDRGYASWLNAATPLNVRLAEKTEMIQKGEVIVAPADRHLIVKNDHLILNDGPRVLNQKPSVDVLFESAVNRFESELIGVLLTGMGKDGANGCVSIYSKGGLTLVQNKETSAIFGMPKAAIELGGASKVLPLGDISKFLVELLAIDAR
jgi:two-component system chemotaxis response regulator CheB